MSGKTEKNFFCGASKFQPGGLPQQTILDRFFRQILSDRPYQI